MFTGLVQALGRISRVEKQNAGTRFTIDWPAAQEPFVVGESIAVSGCCLTIIAVDHSRFVVEAGPETLLRTNLGLRNKGAFVNLERSLQVGARLGGHFVQGHVDATAQIHERRNQEDWAFLTFGIAPDWTCLLVPKGSIAVDGVSLTLIDVGPDEFSVMVIPHTLAATTLGLSSPGDCVNIETDILAKHVRKLLEPIAPASSPGARYPGSKYLLP